MLRRVLPLLAILVLAGCTVSDVRYKDDLPGPHPDPIGDEFTRYDGYGDVAGTLETSVTTWRREGGPAIRLVGAIHIGDAAYYANVQEVLGEADLVLFELVKPEAMDVRDLDPSGGDMYGPLAETIGLASQMQSLDYRQDNFRWLDMSAETFAARLQAIVQRASERLSKIFSGGSSALDFAGALRAAPPAVQRAFAAAAIRFAPPARSADDPIAQILEIVLLPLRAEKAWYAATSSEKAFEDKYKHAVAGSLDQGDPTTEFDALRGQDPVTDILIDALDELFHVMLIERNQVVIDGVKALLDSGEAHANVSIFYGAAHNPGLAEGLQAMGFARDEEIRWLPAIAIRK